MLIRDKHECEKCEKEFEWYYQVPQLWGTGLTADFLPQDKSAASALGRSIEKNGYKIPLQVSARCTKCDHLNNFDIKQKEV
ncbi:hypothetical protein K7T73_12555 [Bacillus badius]|uniref:hypothetical protein n=1 Tax=Bacillus badius TaxID=1455 RepID=UPI001CBD71D7|nr:hypothetical protein [Bacillus badius]UAT29431.1 hypothetical protein K7T73_12555 [Bacillus badius]